MLKRLFLIGVCTIVAQQGCRSRNPGADLDSSIGPKKGEQRPPQVPVVNADEPGQVVFECDDLQLAATRGTPSTIEYSETIGSFPRFDALIAGDLKDKLMEDVGTRLELDEEVMGQLDPNQCIIAPWPQAPIEKQYRDYLGKPLVNAQVVKSAPGEVTDGVLKISGVAQWVGGQDALARGPSDSEGPDFVMLSSRKPMLTKADDEGNYELTIFVVDASVTCGTRGANRTLGIGHYTAKSLPLKNCRVISADSVSKAKD